MSLRGKVRNTFAGFNIKGRESKKITGFIGFIGFRCFQSDREVQMEIHWRGQTDFLPSLEVHISAPRKAHVIYHCYMRTGVLK